MRMCPGGSVGELTVCREGEYVEGNDDDDGAKVKCVRVPKTHRPSFGRTTLDPEILGLAHMNDLLPFVLVDQRGGHLKLFPRRTNKGKPLPFFPPIAILRRSKGEGKR